MCWTFGDYEAKLTNWGGNPKVVIAVPEVKQFEISNEHDFILMGCDGIFDKMNNFDAINSVWKSVSENKYDSIHQYAAVGIDYVMKNSLHRKTLDNVTSVLILFDNFKKTVFGTWKFKRES